MYVHIKNNITIEEEKMPSNGTLKTVLKENVSFT